MTTDAPASPARTILLVEDDSFVAKALTATLEQAGYRTVTVHTGEHAVEIASHRDELDLILLDIELGRGMDGPDAAEAILKTREIPVVFLSSHTDPVVVAKIEKITSYGFISKHSGDTVLLATIKMAFRLHEAHWNHRRDAQESQRRIEKLVGEKETLLKELQHRIKNNMSTITGLLWLQAHSLRDPQAVAALDDARNRLTSLQVLYDHLFCSESIDRASVGAYLKQLVKQEVLLFPRGERVAIHTECDELQWPAKQLSALGLIVNELVTNAMKYAFSDHAEPRLSVAARCRDGTYTVTVSDNGPGLSRSRATETPRQSEESGLSSSGFGSMLITTLTEQLGGTIRYEEDSGTRVVLEFPAEI